MGQMETIRILTPLTKEWNLPDNLKISWDRNNVQQVSDAERVFKQYLDEGWMAFNEEAQGRKQIFKFDSRLHKIILSPPLGGG